MRIALLGGGGFALEMLDLVEALGHTVTGVFDESGNVTGEELAAIGVHDVVGELAADACVLAVGSPELRARFHRLAIEAGFVVPTLVHPTGVVSTRAVIGAGSALMQHVVVNAAAVLGEGVLANVGCCVGHECVIGSHCHMAPGVQLSGRSRVGDGTMLGTGTIVLPGVSVGAGAICGAGSVVTRDVPDGVLVAGVPARVVRVLAEERA